MSKLIALDIDGTLTTEFHSIPIEVVLYLEELHRDGWSIVILTGRPYQFASSILQKLNFPFYIALHNGALILKMPEMQIIQKRYLDHTILSHVEDVCSSFSTDFIVYTGFENQDQCYYRTSRHDPETLKFLQARTEAFNEKWLDVDNFEGIAPFPALKCFVKEQIANDLADKFEGLHGPVIRDPFNPDYYIIQLTLPEVNKGQALNDCKKILNITGTVIAAGDDHDFEMLQAADISVVMETAPDKLKSIADIVAPPAKDKGVIIGLQKAIKDRL